ncbi:MAG: hypothetical protein MUF54_19280, partial [Polyangiaceae bacterium]|nr:hypothetical protein [Polyangiaceae bacterium]
MIFRNAWGSCTTAWTGIPPTGVTVRRSSAVEGGGYEEHKGNRLRRPVNPTCVFPGFRHTHTLSPLLTPAEARALQRVEPNADTQAWRPF